ncbi:MAG: inorganic phosphate transporter [Chloroflexi bacterium]|nr:inorganic phosphate transporter [Chloroflexota bacterium]
MLLGLVLLAAIVFDFINGFHDTANALATVLAALLGAIVWNLLTWYYGIPSSSSHALVGGIVGGAVAHAGSQAPLWGTIVQKTILPFIVSPIIGFAIAVVLMIVVSNTFGRAGRSTMRSVFGRAQLASSAFMAFSHGSNDAQKTMGVVTIALISANMLPKDSPIPTWVIAMAATAMAFGTAAGGWRIIKTMGTRLTHLQPVHGFVAETSAATVIEVASRFGLPLSTTHTIASTIMGVGATRGTSYVRWNVAGNMVTAWILTIPATALTAFLAYQALRLTGLG